MKRIYRTIFIAVLALFSMITVMPPASAQDVEFDWAAGMGGTSSDVGRSIALDASGNVYTTGYFRDTADFDPGAGTFNLTSAGN